MLGLFLGELIFGGAYYWKEFCVSKSVGLTIKTATTNSPWAYIREGLLSEEFLRLRFRGLIFGRAYFWGAYYRNFTVLYSLGTTEKQDFVDGSILADVKCDHLVRCTVEPRHKATWLTRPDFRDLLVSRLMRPVSPVSNGSVNTRMISECYCVAKKKANQMQDEKAKTVSVISFDFPSDWS